MLLGYTLQSSATPSCDEEKHNRPHLDGVQNSIFLGSLRERDIYMVNTHAESNKEIERTIPKVHIRDVSLGAWELDAAARSHSSSNLF